MSRFYLENVFCVWFIIAFCFLSLKLCLDFGVDFFFSFFSHKFNQRWIRINGWSESFFFSCVSLSMFHESSMRFVRNTKSNYIIQQSWTKTDVKNGKNHNTKCVWNEVKTLLENCERNVKCLSLTRFSQCIFPSISFLLFRAKLHNRRHKKM